MTPQRFAGCQTGAVLRTDAGTLHPCGKADRKDDEGRRAREEFGPILQSAERWTRG